MAGELVIRQICPDCGRLDEDGVWRGEGESLEVAYLGPTADGAVVDRLGPGQVDLRVPCVACLRAHGAG